MIYNFMGGFESIHNLKGKSSGNNEACALKIDIVKVEYKVCWNYLFDMLTNLSFHMKRKVCWNYLFDVLTALSFHMKCMQWMSLSFKHVEYKVCVNDRLVGPIIPSKGLQQEDPASPYLFLFMVDGLSLLLRNAV